MEDNNLNSPPVQPENLAVLSPVEPKPQNNSVLKVLSILLIVLVGVVAFLAYQNWVLQKQISLLTATPIPSPAETLVQEGTANWKTYTNEKSAYSIRYPVDFKIDEVVGMTVIYLGEKLILSPNSPIDPYPATTIAVLDRNDPNLWKNAQEACQIEGGGGEYCTQKFQVNNATGVGVDGNYYVNNFNGSKIVKITYILSNDINTIRQILSTFKFLGEETTTISAKELSNGWYWGLLNQKKPDTPKDWIFTEAGKSSCWHKLRVDCI